MARLVGALGLLDVLLSVGGQSFVAPFFTAPQGQCCVFSLDVAVWRVGGHKRKYAAMMQSSSRAGVKASMLSLPSRRPLSLFGWWLVSFVSIFAGWPSWGASRPDGKKRQFEVQRRSSVYEMYTRSGAGGDWSRRFALRVDQCPAALVASPERSAVV
jgi:hypothetical protein